MPKYINADEAIAILKDTNEYEREHAELISEFITEQPSADVVEVVRCKDCIHREKYECHNITLGTTKCSVTDDWFCADGERKETE